MKRHRKPNKKKLDEVMGLADVGAIDEQEFERRWQAAGGTIEDRGLIEDASDEHLVTMFALPSATGGMKAYLASLLVKRGLTACGCPHCREVEALAARWEAHVKKLRDEEAGR